MIYRVTHPDPHARTTYAGNLPHTPTVRVKELSGGVDGLVYAEALRELVQLDARDTAAVATPPMWP